MAAIAPKESDKMMANSALWHFTHCLGKTAYKLIESPRVIMMKRKEMTMMRVCDTLLHRLKPPQLTMSVRFLVLVFLQCQMSFNSSVKENSISHIQSMQYSITYLGNENRRKREHFNVLHQEMASG